jgi:hypothetical protein
MHAFGEIRTHNPSKQAAADPRLRPRGNEFLRGVGVEIYKYMSLFIKTVIINPFNLQKGTNREIRKYERPARYE